MFVGLMYYFLYYNWFFVWLIFYIAPQIVHNAMRGGRPQFYGHYLFGILTPPFIIPLYFRGCPENILSMAPNLNFCISWVLLFMVQMIIILIQSLKGSRFFIPKSCIPGYYNYYV